MPEEKFADIKNWSVEIEKKITEDWKNSSAFNFNPNSKKKIYSIDTPPPYINTPIHMGHAITYCFMDMFARYKRMKGYEVLFPLGLDRNGLPIEMATEKKFNISPFTIGREKFIEYCEKLLKETSIESTDSFAKLGISFSSYKQGDKIGEVYLTDSQEYRAITQATFIDLFKKKIIYEDKRINNWDTKLQTTIADSEIEYKDIQSKFNDIKFRIKNSGEEVVIGTTRPELICTCGMIIFNPKDERYKHLEGKTAITPLFNKEVPIKSHPIAQIDKGTGLVMMCSAGDLSDIQFFREQNLKPVIAIGKDGRMNENSGFLKGLKVKEAREKIIEELKNKSLLIKQSDILHRTPVSERSNSEIEFIEMEEFYLKQLNLKEQVRSIAKKMNFFPEESFKILDDWIDSISIDWPISRRRYYATPIPLWHCEEMIALPKEGKYYVPWKEKVPEDADVIKDSKIIGKVKDFKGKEWIGEERVFDTWFDSSISELAILKYKKNNEFFKRAYPASLRPQGKEIVRTWLYYTILRGILETGKPCFKDVWIHQHILDSNGRKMSKSLGNVIDPKEILNEYGAEALRLWSSTEGDLSKGDFICSKEKIKAELKALNKILNVSKFVMQFEKPKKAEICSIDQLFIDFIEKKTEYVESMYEKYDFNHPAIFLRKFLWDIFASNYIEVIKNRAYNQENKFSEKESNSAKYTLHYLLERFVILIYPIIPQISSVILKEMKIDILKLNFPEPKIGKSNISLVDKIIEFNSLVWKAKKDKGMSLKSEIEGIIIPKELKEFEKDLISCHNLK